MTSDQLLDILLHLLTAIGLFGMAVRFLKPDIRFWRQLATVLLLIAGAGAVINLWEAIR